MGFSFGHLRHNHTSYHKRIMYNDEMFKVQLGPLDLTEGLAHLVPVAELVPLVEMEVLAPLV